MYIMILMNLILVSLSVVILLLNMFISKKVYFLRDKVTCFECGFDSLSYLRLPFSIQFYLISIIFLIFDVEISLIFPIIKLVEAKLFKFWFIFFYIILILIIGVYYEFKEGSLNWVL